ncbi:hypothetical protein Tsubulata_013806 [Turnera subulata]|uniref:Uncharacterized protein n=1 Tax=Turnera subulata TaxID=218843 RepID=A0A9Q0J4E7_9ROSI|nr:hypothetical protein Tsubulata_013806 [Turnera subulata]
MEKAEHRVTTTTAKLMSFTPLPRRPLLRRRRRLFPEEDWVGSRYGDVRKPFDEMPERNEVSWSGMIYAYAQLGEDEEALVLFKEALITMVVYW